MKHIIKIWIILLFQVDYGVVIFTQNSLQENYAGVYKYFKVSFKFI